MTTPAPVTPPALRLVGHAGTALCGVLLLVSGVATVFTTFPLVLAVAQLIFGVAALGLAYASWLGSRVGWAFGMTLDGVLAVILLFATPKIAHAVEIAMGVAALPCVLAAVSCALLATLGIEYDK